MLFDDLFAISLIPGVGDKTLKKASEFITANALLNASEDELADVFPQRKPLIYSARLLTISEHSQKKSDNS